MSQLQQKTSKVGLSLLRTAASSTLALTAFGGAFLAGGEAKAVVCYNFAGGIATPIGIPPCVDGDFTLEWIAGPNSGTGNIELEDLVPGAIGDEAKVDVDWTPALTTGTGSFQYTLFHDSQPFRRSSVILVTNPLAVNPLASLTKTIYDNSTFTGPPLATINVNQANPQGIANYSGVGNQIWVQVDYNGTEIDNIVDYHEVPGPLPILGAGAAFGFSRKLRSRIKTSRLA